MGDGPDDVLIAARRGATPDRLRRSLRGDLETILAKALRKDPAMRYASAAEFGDDLRRYVDHKPITARPEAVGYRAAKFARRHWQVLAASAVTVLLLLGTAGYYTVQLAAERDRARAEAEKAARVSDLMTRILTGVDPYRTPDRTQPSIVNLLDAASERVLSELSDQPSVQAELLNTIGRTYQRLSLNDKALPILQAALDTGRRAFGAEDVRIAQSLNELGVLERDMGHPDKALDLLTQSLAMRRRLLPPDDKDIAVTLVEQSRAFRDLGRLGDAMAPAAEALEIRKRIFGDHHRETATSKWDVARIRQQRGDMDRAEPLFREAYATHRDILGEDHPNTTSAKANIGFVLAARGEFVEAERLYRESLASDIKTFGPESQEAATMMNNFALTLEAAGKLEEASQLFEHALRIVRQRFSEDNARTMTHALNATRVAIALGRVQGTEPVLRHILEQRTKMLATDDWRVAQAQSVLASSLLAQHRVDEARALMEAADRVLKPVPGPQAREFAANRARLSSLQSRSR